MRRTILVTSCLISCLATACQRAPQAPATAQASTAATEVERGAATTAATETLPAHAPLAASSQAADVQPLAEPGLVAESGITTGPVAASAGQAATEAEDDYAALYGGAAPQAAAAVAPEAVSYDPWEPMNRRIHAFNNAIDSAGARPIAVLKAWIRRFLGPHGS